MITHFDHFGTYLRDNDLIESLARWKRAGFTVLDAQSRFTGGKLNGFVALTGGYLEFMSVEDEAEFGKTVSEFERNLRRDPRNLITVFATQDPKTCASKIPGFPSLSSVDSRFIILPPQLTPGAFCSAMRYPATEKTKFLEELVVGPNTIFGITGTLFCSIEAPERRARWQTTFARVLCGFEATAKGFATPVQKAEWMNPDEYRVATGESWKNPYAPHLELAILVLGADDVRKAFEAMSQENFKCRWLDEERFYVCRDTNSGYEFIVEQGDSEKFHGTLRSLKQAFAD